jgi:Sugar (and other) transporter
MHLPSRWLCLCVLGGFWVHSNDKSSLMGMLRPVQGSMQADNTPQRFPIGFQAAFAIVSGIGMFLLPDTPRWYYAKGRIEEGDDVLARLHDRPVDDSAVQEMKEAILASIKLEEEEEHKFNVLDLFWDRTDLRSGRRIRIAFLILSMQQMMGKPSSSLYVSVGTS